MPFERYLLRRFVAEMHKRIKYLGALMIIVISSGTVQSQSINEKTIQEPLPCLNRHFEIVVHAFKDSLGVVPVDLADFESNVDSLDRYWAPLCVTFSICEIRIHPNFQYNVIFDPDELDEMQNEFHVPHRINAYVFDQWKEDPPGQGKATLGGIAMMDKGGLFFASESFGTLPHEMGHFWGLPHTFEVSNGLELVDGSNCETAGDGVCDTPADPYDESGTEAFVDASTCRFIYKEKDANGDYYDPIVGNLMDYYPGECACGLTHGQYMKMVRTYHSNPIMW